MTSRMVKYISKHGILSNNQFGFREGRSTSDAVLEFVNDCVDALEGGLYTVAVMLDLSKAFDTVNHEVLLRKLDRMGFRGIVSSWFKSFLSNRKIKVLVGDSCSEERNLNIGLPQGSVSSPLLFLLYINDMNNVCPELKNIQFADDTTLYMSGRNLSNLCQKVNQSLSNIDKWLISNRLSLNVSKTNFMILTHNDFNEEDADIKIRNVPLVRVRMGKFLGITVDDKLKFTDHINEVCIKLSRAMGVLFRMSTLVPLQILRSLYYAIFYPHLIYGIVIWGRCGITNINRIKRIHKRAEKLIGQRLKLTDSTNIFLTVDNVITFFIALKFFKCIHFNNHSYFTQKLLQFLPDHSHLTRAMSSDTFNSPFYTKSISQHFFLYQGIKVWNALPSHIKEIESIHLFKSKLKRYLSDFCFT